MDSKKEIFLKLQQDLLLLQGFKPQASGKAERVGLGEIEQAFPYGVFPRQAIHEFVCHTPAEAAAADGFIAGLLGSLMTDGAGCVWIGTRRRLFPAALASFGLEPDRIIFIDVKSEKEVLWIMEEALRCDGLAAVVAEVDGLSLIDSRRLQLAVEKNGIPGLVIRKDLKRMASTVSTARWRIVPVPSIEESGMPGVGFPRWEVELLKVRSGSPGKWLLEWQGDGFVQLDRAATEAPVYLPFENIG